MAPGARCSISPFGYAIRGPRQPGSKIFSPHAPEVECLGRGKANAAYEFGCKVSITTPVTIPKGGPFVLHDKALRNPIDGHTLGPIIADLEKLTGAEVTASMSTTAIAGTITRTASAARWVSVSFGGIPGEGMLMRPSAPFSL